MIKTIFPYIKLKELVKLHTTDVNSQFWDSLHKFMHIEIIWNICVTTQLPGDSLPISLYEFWQFQGPLDIPVLCQDKFTNLSKYHRRIHYRSFFRDDTYCQPLTPSVIQENKLVKVESYSTSRRQNDKKYQNKRIPSLQRHRFLTSDKMIASKWYCKNHWLSFFRLEFNLWLK